MQLSECSEPLAYQAALSFLALQDVDGYDLKYFGQDSLELCRIFRTLAIIALLVKNDTDKFLHHLIRSAGVREVYLTRLKKEGALPELHFISGRYDGLLDAIASGNSELAARIAWVSPREWDKRYEYEDDFCYAQMLHRLVHGVQATAAYHPFIDRFEEILKGQTCPRLEIVRALVLRSQIDFDNSFEALLQERQDEIAANIARCQLEEPQIVAERQVFVEGLALLRLAASVGLTTQTEYLYCPSNARLPMRTPVPIIRS